MTAEAEQAPAPAAVAAADPATDPPAEEPCRVDAADTSESVAAAAADSQEPVDLRPEDGGEGEERAREEGGGGGDGGGGGGGGGKRGERKGFLFLPEAKRKKPSPADEEPAEGGGEEDPRNPREESRSFSFSFDATAFPAPTINTTPKFGSFNFSAIVDPSLAPAPQGAATAAGIELVRSSDGDGAILPHKVEL